MSSSLNVSFFSHNSGMENDVLGSKPIGCLYNLPRKKREDKLH